MLKNHGDIINDPWEHKNLENFLSQERFDKLKQLAVTELEYLDMFGFYCRSGHYVRYVKHDIVPEVTQDMFNDMPKRKHTDLKKLIHWSIQPKGFSFPEHIDNDSRISTAILYVSPEENCGTILCRNNSSHVVDHGAPKMKSDYEVTSARKPKTLFTHNSINGKTWHRYEATEQRCTLNIFFVQPDLIAEGRLEKRFLIDIK